jgi:DNA-binding beta-propeller fold protein YncE
MAIDGYIYILYQDGTVEKYLGGEIQPFETGDIPGDLAEVAGFAVDPDGDGTVYIADRGNNRIVVLSPEGQFESQLLAEPPLASLEALAVSQADRRLYVLAAGQVYEGALP